mmetsp:Transcript_456/g.774  ORF Transcript_456/g.774 Transcript_456/m.774 type:complete len:274 (-) Transcript_456:98-919(-)
MVSFPVCLIFSIDIIMSCRSRDAFIFASQRCRRSSSRCRCSENALNVSSLIFCSSTSFRYTFCFSCSSTCSHFFSWFSLDRVCFSICSRARWSYSAFSCASFCSFFSIIVIFRSSSFIDAILNVSLRFSSFSRSCCAFRTSACRSCSARSSRRLAASASRASNSLRFLARISFACCIDCCRRSSAFRRISSLALCLSSFAASIALRLSSSFLFISSRLRSTASCCSRKMRSVSWRAASALALASMSFFRAALRFSFSFSAASNDSLISRSYFN